MLTNMVKKVAVIGFSFRLPNNTNKNNYWQHLSSGLDLVTQVDPARWSFDTYLHPNKQHPGTSYTFAAGSVGDISQFDAPFFGISPREAELMDPQQRYLLQLTWEAIEDAGIAPATLRAKNVGVYIGLSSNDYAFRMADDAGAVDSSTATGNTASIASNRISYAFDLRGPSMSLDTACSSSLVAFHQACLSIRSGETSMAIAGGISLHLHPYGFITFSKASMLSPKGRCKVFDAAGDGYVRSEGGGLFFLKDYDQAVADGDRIHAVVLHSSVNTDGHKQGITVPNYLMQSQLINKTMQAAGLHPDDLDYVEAHGTGTAIGDPIETKALGIALGQERKTPLPIGSTKSNMGHLETASGAAGLIKLLYAFKHRQVPPTIGIQQLNPAIDFEGLNLQVNQELLDLPSDKTLRMSINSFGFGGSNAHIILESPNDALVTASAIKQPCPLLLSAKSEFSLKAYATQLASFIESNKDISLYDVAYQLYQRREAHTQRTLLFAESNQDAVQTLQRFANDEQPNAPITQGPYSAENGPVFVFSGNGSQWQGMGQRLLDHPVFLQTIQQIDHFFAPLSQQSIEAILREDNAPSLYDHTDIAQPALFALQVGLVQLFAHHGVNPAAVVGHSVGEVAAAWASGALNLEQAVCVIFERSRLQETTKGQGQMTAISLSADQMMALVVEQNLTDRITIAGANSSTGCTIAGLASDLDEIEAICREQGVRLKRLPLDYAFHSPYMDSIQTELQQNLAHLSPCTTRIPMYSTVTGAIIDGQDLDAEYWWKNIRQPVLFEPAINAILKDKQQLFVEIGPHPVLRSYVQQAARDLAIDAQVTMLSQRHNEDLAKVIQRIQETLISRQQPNLDSYFPAIGQFVDLPHYAWDLESYWHPVTPEGYRLINRSKEHHLLGYPLPQQQLVWESQLDTALYPYLADHVVGEAILLPGAAFLEIALAAAKQIHPNQSIAIENLTIPAPLVLQEQPSKRVRTSVDEDDGRLRIRSKTVGQEDNWTEHAQARVIEHANYHWQQTEHIVAPLTTPDFDQRSHHALTQLVGLDYGPCFCAIKSGWKIDDTHILVELSHPEQIQSELEHSVLHPALVDSSFQSIIHLLLKHPLFGKGVAFVPVQLEQAYVRTDLGAIRYAKTTFLRLNPHSLCANFDFYNTEGVHLAHLSEVRFRSARLQKTEPMALSYLDYALTPRPLHCADQTHLLVNELTQQLSQSFTAIAASTEQRQINTEVDPLLDSLADLYTKEAVWSYQQHTPITQRHLQQLQQEQPSTYALLHVLLLRLEQIAEAQWHDEHLVIQKPDTWANDIWADLARDYSAAFPLFLLVARIGMHLEQVLTTQTQLKDLRPAHASLSELINSALGTHNHSLLIQNLSEYVLQQQQSLPAGQRLRILEINDQGPWFAQQHLRVLDKNQSDYVYGSLNPEAIEQGQQLAEDYPQLHCQALDSTLTPDATFDLVLINADLSEPSQVETILAYAKEALLPNGACVVIGIHSSYWQSFSYLDLPYHGVMPQQLWLETLEQQLGTVTTLELTPENPTTAYALVSKKSATPIEIAKPDMSTQWYLIADTPIAQALATQLQSLLGADNTHCVEQFDPSTLQENQQIVYLGGLQSSDNVIEAQQKRCADLMHLIQHYPYQNQHLWVICAQANTYAMLSKQEANTEIAALNDAATWGFGRSLQNESDKLTVHLVDLPWLSDSNQLITTAQLLAKELQYNSPEKEVIYQTNGQRYTPRLQVVAPPASAKGPIEKDVRLHFTHAGQLRNLRWHYMDLPSLRAKDIQVRIHATGLNFRDVMYTLGMLSDEAVENGFAGASLGLEFAGVVESIGSEVTDYKPGDRVVGFGSHSFGTRTISDSSAMAPLPDFISFEAAATIPSTFFTVYYALHHLARLEPGERILIHGAAGGVGIAAIQFAQSVGAEIYATAGSDEKRDFLRLMGVKHIYDSRSLRFAGDILADTQHEGVDVVLNSLAGEAINRNLHILRPFGRFLELGKRDFYQNSRIGLRPFRNNISYFGIDADQLMRAKPALTQRLFKEVMALMAAGKLAPLPYHLFNANQIVDAFRYMQQAKQIGKIVVTYEQPIRHVDAPTEKTSLQLNENATYLITGGLGGFGLRTAQWLVEKGAKHLVLLSRRGASSEEAQQALTDFESSGIQVQAIACDVSQAEQVASAFAHIQQTMPKLKGIVHAATVIDDSLIINMQAEQIRRVLEPKILGAIHLHQQSLLLEQPLDLFVVYSSATTLFGNLGQSNYVAANYWLEALMGLRQQMGLAATAVRWGAIDDVGFLARNSQIKDALQGRMGGEALPAALALQALESMLIHHASHLGVMELDWSALDRFLPTAKSPKFADMAHLVSEQDHDGNEENWTYLLATLTPTELQDYTKQLIKIEVSEILRLSVQKIDENQSIYDMGLDSLLGVELVLALEAKFGVRIPVMSLTESPTIARLADKLIGLLHGNNTDSGLESEVARLTAQHNTGASAETISQTTKNLLSDLEQPSTRIIQ